MAAQDPPRPHTFREALLINGAAVAIGVLAFGAATFVASDVDGLHIAGMGGVAMACFYVWSIVLAARARSFPWWFGVALLLEPVVAALAISGDLRRFVAVQLPQILPLLALLVGPPLVLGFLVALPLAWLALRRMERRSAEKPWDGQTRLRRGLLMLAASNALCFVLFLPWTLCSIAAYGPVERPLLNRVGALTPGSVIDLHDELLVQVNTPGAQQIHRRFVRTGTVSVSRLEAIVKQDNFLSSAALRGLRDKAPSRAVQLACDVARLKLIATQGDTRSVAGLIMAQSNHDVIAEVLRSDAPPDLKMALVRGLIEHKRSEYWPLVRENLRQPGISKAFTVNALWSLLPDSELEAVWNQLLTDSDGIIRLLAAQKIAYPNRPVPPRMISQALTNPAAAVRRQMLSNLFRLQAIPEVVATHRRALDDPDLICRRIAAHNVVKFISGRVASDIPFFQLTENSDGIEVVSSPDPETDREKQAMESLRAAVDAWLRQRSPSK
ncbi:MAG TPA: hypothetical protein VEK08_17800 [Planctomycetota bacterium]|nr:hypothetical protein [Planctomycetota bacterium]